MTGYVAEGQGLFNRVRWGCETCSDSGSVLTGFCSDTASGLEYQELEVHLKRQKSGFGFRILGGDEAGQPVSLETCDKARMGRVQIPPFYSLTPPPAQRSCDTGLSLAI